MSCKRSYFGDDDGYIKDCPICNSPLYSENVKCRSNTLFCQCYQCEVWVSI